MRWFRFYDDAVHDLKVQKLPGDLFKAWVNILSLASKGRDELGLLPPIEEGAFMLRLTVPEYEAHLEALLAAKLLDKVDGGLAPHNWDERQRAHDSSTERTRRYRQRERDIDGTSSDDGADVTVTEGDGHGDALDKTREEKKRKEKRPSRHTVTSPSGFAAWYEAYPKRVGRGAALTAYARALKKANQETLLAGAKRAAVEFSSTDPKYIPQPATWLNQERWLDEETKPKRLSAKDNPLYRGVL